jgi:hypothetical protein
MLRPQNKSRQPLTNMYAELTKQLGAKDLQIEALQNLVTVLQKQIDGAAAATTEAHFAMAAALRTLVRN